MINRRLIKKKRLEMHMSQTELALAIGYTDKSIISRIENGKVKDIPLTKAVLLSRVLKIEIQELVKGGFKEKENQS